MRVPIQKGIALISVMMVMGVLLMMTISFIQVNRDNIAQVNSSEKRDRAQAACAAVYNYVLYRLEHDKTFGTAPFSGEKDTIAAPEMRVTEVAASNRLEGEIPALQATFTATLSNNLNVDATSVTGVPAHSALLEVTCDSNGIQRSVETLIRVAPLFDSSALSRGSMNIEANSFRVRSRDKYRNLVRSEGEVRVPSVLSGTPRTRFLEPESNVTDSKGMIWAKDKIFAGGDDIAGDLLDANSNSGGRFVPEAKQHFQIHDLQASDIQLPTSTIPVRAGEYRFTMATATIKAVSAHHYEEGSWPFEHREDAETPWETTQLIHVMEYYEKPGQPSPTRVFRSNTRLDDIKPPDLRGTIDSTTVTDVQIVYDTPGANSAAVPVIANDTVYIDEVEGSNKVAVDLLNQRIVLPPGETVSANGDFKVTTDLGEPPFIELGSTSSDRAAIVADGTINLEAGVTGGFGTLVAKSGDLLLRPEGTLAVDVTSNGYDGLVAYAGQDVILKNPSDSGRWTFNGLVYASRNFKFDANNADTRLEGTLVARDGNIDFLRAGDVDFVYNPDYLDAMLKGLPENRVELERVYWKE